MNLAKIVSPEILLTNFFEAVVDTLRTRGVGILHLNQMTMTYELLALQLDPNRRDGEGRWRMGGGVEEKEGGSEVGQRKEERVGCSNEARHSRRRVPACL